MQSTAWGTRFRSERIANFTESVIREMTRLALAHDAVNLAQGFPDFGAPEEIKRAACAAIEADVNQYTITWGARAFREAIAAKYRRWYGLDYDPEREVTVCCGSTEGMIASLLAVVNPGDEVIVFEPFYENYRPDSLLCGATTRLVTLHAPEWRFDPDELRRAFTPRTRAIIVNTPHNPTGKVFERAELETIAGLCQEFDALAITDEIYEHILYDGARHIPIATLPGMRERTLIVNSMSKTYSVTGWRTGWVAGPAAISEGLRKVHDFLTVNAPAPLQQAGVVAMSLDESYYEQLAARYTEKRDALMGTLEGVGFRCFRPRGAYYVMCDIARFGFSDDLAFARHLVEDIGVSAVPGSSFFERGGEGKQLIRFCFCKREDTLAEAERRLEKLR